MTTKCHKAIILLQEDEKHGENLLHNFMNMCVRLSYSLETLKARSPCMICRNVQSELPSLLRVLYDVYRALTSTAGVKQNHKTNKHVLNPTRCRMNDDRLKKQECIAQDWAHLKRAQARKRSKLGACNAHSRFADSSDVSMETEKVIGESNDSKPARNPTLELAGSNPRAFRTPSDPFEDDFERVVTAEEVELKHNVWDLAKPTLIFDAILFKTD